MNPIFAENTLDQIVTTEKVAAMLGISTATVRNWVKCGHIRPLEPHRQNDFAVTEIENIRRQIQNGELEKLNKRANKSRAEKTFIPDEYLGDDGSITDVQKIVSFIQEKQIDVQLALLLLALNILEKSNVVTLTDEVSDFGDLFLSKFTNDQLRIELAEWLQLIEKPLAITEELQYLLKCNIPGRRDFLGVIYQSLLFEGSKSKQGSYYTPKEIVNSIVCEYVSDGMKALDPCCGTGQFLLSFAEKISDPEKIYGIDIDPTAVRIARFNVLLFYKDKKFSPNIVCKNTLFDIGKYDLFSLDDENIKDFDVIATNPPWGLHFSKQDADKLEVNFCDITSGESFSYFLSKSIELLADGGVLSFILPESILNVKTHQDIRKIIIDKSKILKVSYLDRVFKNVFTPVVRLDLKKVNDRGSIEILKGKEKYSLNQSRWQENESNIFDIHVNNQDEVILDKVYRIPHQTLKGKAEWALGIVTGDNKRHLTNKKGDGREAVFKGKEVEKFVLAAPSNFIEFTPDKFQQVAPVEKYRAEEKLIYRFISKRLVFAYDDKQSLTLNSANVVIPRIENYPMKVIAAIFNSSLYQFLFQKKFSTIKVLRGHLEQLPLPQLDEDAVERIAKLVDSIIHQNRDSGELDQFILDIFGLTESEKEHIINFNQ